MDDSAFELIETFEIALASANKHLINGELLDLLDDDFQEIGKSGRVYTKEALAPSLMQAHTFDVTLIDFNFRKLSESVILVHYKSISQGVTALQTSIWIRNNSQWRMLHHQGTVSPS